LDELFGMTPSMYRGPIVHIFDNSGISASMQQISDIKIKEGIKLREVANQWVAVPGTNDVSEPSYFFKLSPSAALLWKELERGVEDAADLAETLFNVYEIDYETALHDSEDLVEELKLKGLLEYSR